MNSGKFWKSFDLGNIEMFGSEISGKKYKNEGLAPFPKRHVSF